MTTAVRPSPVCSPSVLAAVDGDLTASQRRHGPVEVRLASLRGPAHRALGEPRQDAAGLVALADRSDLVAGVADGLGSVPFSHLGAQSALRSALAVLATRPPSDGSPAPADLEAALAGAVDQARAAADLVGCDAAAVSTTLVVAWVDSRPFEDGSLGCVLVSVGDSSAYLLDPSDEGGAGRWRRAFDHGDPTLPSNVVRWHLPRRPDGAVFVGLRVPLGGTLVLCTDGVGDLIDSDADFGAELARRWARPRPLLHFVSDLSYDAHHDDRSAVVVWNTGGADPSGEVQR